MREVCQFEAPYDCDGFGCEKRTRVFVENGNDLLCYRCAKELAETLLLAAKKAEEREEALR